MQIIRGVGPARKLTIPSASIDMRQLHQLASANFVAEGLISPTSRTCLTDSLGNSLAAFPSLQMYVNSIPVERLSRITIILAAQEVILAAQEVRMQYYSEA